MSNNNRNVSCTGTKTCSADVTDGDAGTFDVLGDRKNNMWTAKLKAKLLPWNLSLLRLNVFGNFR